MKTKKIKFKIRYILFLLLLLGVGKVGIKKLPVEKTLTFFFNIRTINPVNFNSIDSLAIISKLNYLHNRNLFDIKNSEVLDTLNSMIGIKDVKVRKTLTGKVVIQKIIKTPVAFTKLNNKVMYIDKDRRLHEVGFGKIYNVPFITGLKIDTLGKDNYYITKNDWKKYKLFLSLCEKNKIKFTDIEHITFDEFNIRLFLKNLNPLIVLSNDNLDLSLENLMVLLQKLSNSEKKYVRKIDLTCVRLAFVK